MMKNVDCAIKPRGIFQLWMKEGDKDPILVREDHNLIVNNAGILIRNALFGDLDQSPVKIVIGTGGVSGVADTVYTPTIDQSSLVDPVYAKQLLKVKDTYDDAPAIKFSAELDADECNGNGSILMAEFGLSAKSNADFIDDEDESKSVIDTYHTDRLFAIKTVAPVEKTKNRSYSFKWIIVFN